MWMRAGEEAHLCVAELLDRDLVEVADGQQLALVRLRATSDEEKVVRTDEAVQARNEQEERGP